MTKLINLLLNYYFKAKDLHYKALNEGRLGDHAFFDRLTDGVFDDIDSIQEVVNGVDGNFAKTPEIIKIVNGTTLELIGMILDLLEEELKNKDISEGTKNLMNSMSQKYQQFYSFLRKYKE